MDKRSKERDRPGLRARLRLFWRRYGAGLLLTGGAVSLAAGAGMIYPPAGWIAGGLLAMAAGVLSILGGEDT